MTASELYTSLMIMYKNLMFPPPSIAYGGEIKRTGWTMSDIDQMDVHFFDALFSERVQKAEEEIKTNAKNPQDKEQYLSDIW
ncbi:hypothetical protein [Oceanobacillus sp. J11TS1]|uniref:hypothetical protein n=1 Tax=Oceanobacillus sp. J11TS1 TaxID=2807191 RepID=UPI001B259C0D|nr:hypothetical protein [Oceanobacillus sp. J11TS1]GIO22427.1 hypothetical protein J11TS1_10080 [Oceanobacillus sp. J11TS1]